MWYSLDGKTKAGLVALSSAAIAFAGYIGYGQLTKVSAGGAKPIQFQVHVAGAVRSPQVVWVDSETLVVEAIERAGGQLPDADTDELNLAAKLQPNTQLYEPRIGEDAEDRLGPYSAKYTVSRPSGSGSVGPVTGEIGLININTADAATLEHLPGIGPATSQAIVDYRNQHGPFRSVEELTNVKGIGPKKMEQIRAFVTVN